MKLISFKWLITTFLILGIIFSSIGIVNDNKPCQKIIYISALDNDDYVDAETVYNDMSKNIENDDSISSNIDKNHSNVDFKNPYIIDSEEDDFYQETTYITDSEDNTNTNTNIDNPYYNLDEETNNNIS